jgi:hypothetical protein
MKCRTMIELQIEMRGRIFQQMDTIRASIHFGQAGNCRDSPTLAASVASK